MKKIVKSVFVLSMMVLLLTGCYTKKSFVYNVSTGDKIKVELTTTDGYDLTAEVPFAVKKEDQVLSQGMFIQGEYYDQYVAAAEENGTVLKNASDKNIEYIFYTYDNPNGMTEFNYVIKVKNSDTALLLANANSQSEAEKCFELLSFSVEK